MFTSWSCMYCTVSPNSDEASTVKSVTFRWTLVFSVSQQMKYGRTASGELGSSFYMCKHFIKSASRSHLFPYIHQNHMCFLDQQYKQAIKFPVPMAFTDSKTNTYYLSQLAQRLSNGQFRSSGPFALQSTDMVPCRQVPYCTKCNTNISAFYI